jgi:hypothetical protein
LSTLLPTVPQMLCLFHINRNIDQRIKQTWRIRDHPAAIPRPALTVSEPASAVSEPDPAISQISSAACSQPSPVVISRSSSADVSQPRRRGRPPGPRTAARDLTRPRSTRVAKTTEVSRQNGLYQLSKAELIGMILQNQQQ